LAYPKTAKGAHFVDAVSLESCLKDFNRDRQDGQDKKLKVTILTILPILFNFF
jgi:hypothetical protein